MKANDERAGFVPLRGAAGRLLGYFHPERMVIEIKRKNEAAEQIDLKPYLKKITAL